MPLSVSDYYPNGKRWFVRLHEKGGKEHQMPAHHKLERFMDEYLTAAGIADAKKSPLWRTTYRKTRRLPLEVDGSSGTRSISHPRP